MLVALMSDTARGRVRVEASAKRALICGVSGQDGAYLARLLLEKGYTVIGASRDAELSSFHNLRVLNILGQIETVSIALTDFRSVLQVMERAQPDEIYNLAGQSSVGLSFEQPVETFDSIGVGVLNLLEVIRFRGRPVRFSRAPALCASAAVVPAAIGAVATKTWTGCWSASARSFTPLT